jgi:hypothetical protein
VTDTVTWWWKLCDSFNYVTLEIFCVESDVVVVVRGGYGDVAPGYDGVV